MTPLKPIENLFAVEVDDNAYDFEIRKPYFYRLLYLVKGTENPLTGGEKCITVDLGKDNFEILFTTSDVTEEKLVQAGIATKWLFLDILSSNNLDPDKNYLLIKRNEQ